MLCRLPREFNKIFMGKDLAIYGSKGYTKVEYECTDNWQELPESVRRRNYEAKTFGRLYGSMPDTDLTACNGVGC